MVSWHAGPTDNERASRPGPTALVLALSLVGVVGGAVILAASGAGTVVFVVLGLAVATVNVVLVLESKGHDDLPSAIRYRVSRLYVWTLVVGTVIVTGVGTVGLLIATALGTNPPPIPFTVAFLLGSGVIWYLPLTRFAIGIIVWPNDGRVVFRCLAKERQTQLGDIESISKPPLGRRGNAVTVSYREGSVRVLMYLDWNDFIRRVRERNPQIEVNGF